MNAVFTRKFIRLLSDDLKALRAIRHDDFASVVKYGRIRSRLHHANIIYAWYRLGCYSTTVQLGAAGKPNNAREVTALILSNAALGRFEECDSIFTRYSNLLDGRRRYQLEVARGLAKYKPDLALKIVEKVKKVSDLKASIYASMGDIDRGLDALSHNTHPTKSDLNSGHYFIQANLLNNQNEKFRAINMQMDAYNLEHLSPKYNHHDISVNNLAAIPGNHAENGPLVSIIVPVYNCEKYVEATITSLCSQSYSNLEILVVDDGSTDKTAEIVEALALQDPRIELIKLGNNQGVYRTRNTGLRACSGYIVTVNDGDDYAHPRKIERQVGPILNSTNIIFTISDLVRLNSCGEMGKREVYPVQRLNTASLTFLREKVLNECGEWDETKFGADSEFLFRLKHFYGPNHWARIREPLTFAADDSDSLTRSIPTGGLNLGSAPERIAYTEKYVSEHIHRE